MTTFDQREEAFENRFAHDEELLFKAKSRRAAKVARWAAGLMGKTPAEAESYADALVSLDVSEGDGALLSRLRADLAGSGATVSEHQIARHMDDALAEAQREVHEG